MFDDVRGGVPGCIAKGQRVSMGQVMHTFKNRFDRKLNSSCKVCGKAHPKHNCWRNKNKSVSAGSEIASSADFHSSNKRENWQNRGQNWNRGRNNYRWNQLTPGRDSNRTNSNEKVDHQVYFCKVRDDQGIA